MVLFVPILIRRPSKVDIFLHSIPLTKSSTLISTKSSVSLSFTVIQCTRVFESSELVCAGSAASGPTVATSEGNERIRDEEEVEADPVRPRVTTI